MSSKPKHLYILDLLVHAKRSELLQDPLYNSSSLITSKTSFIHAVNIPCKSQKISTFCRQDQIRTMANKETLQFKTISNCCMARFTCSATYGHEISMVLGDPATCFLSTLKELQNVRSTANNYHTSSPILESSKYITKAGD